MFKATKSLFGRLWYLVQERRYSYTELGRVLPVHLMEVLLEKMRFYKKVSFCKIPSEQKLLKQLYLNVFQIALWSYISESTRNFNLKLLGSAITFYSVKRVQIDVVSPKLHIL